MARSTHLFARWQSLLASRRSCLNNKVITVQRSTHIYDYVYVADIPMDDN